MSMTTSAPAGPASADAAAEVDAAERDGGNGVIAYHKQPSSTQ